MVTVLPPFFPPSLPLSLPSSLPVSFFSVLETQLFFAVGSGKVFRLETEGSRVVSSLELRGHAHMVYQILTLGARTLPRHWLPSIIGRSNAIQYYR